MRLDEVIGHCLGKPGAEETYPWGESELVVKVGGKAFAFIALEAATVGVKCGVDAEAASPWRERFPDAITVSAYIGRYGWNRIDLDKGVPEDEVLELLDLSYDSVVAKLPKSKRP
ncbi:MmcQ/YjbR family DNA-binding protein [Saccharothrix violaceirubra]|uniref:Putative DNA-binding protein (MmcQ/YjbR family) n=1 Tax=Saccharothrix violaceirubra TaxID=413306 RepID=A0A7W7T0L8_9PSEU|nr:MmcQ/YjbR family DNA-binding protein [Saccharothrix violaceirubra]MBB4964315.1 putative DNA-binding protein (MmcQ/YjbR family) [Saccharothrix violaceirubra]